jgi:hypothetical protein
MESEIKKSIKSSKAFLKNVSDNELETLMQEFDDYVVEETIFNTVNKRKKDKNTPTLNIENIPTNKDCINSIKRQLKNKGYKID